MKLLLSWVVDPCVHLILIGLALFYLSMNPNPQTDSNELSEENFVCLKCNYVHTTRPACPVIVVKFERTRVLD